MFPFRQQHTIIASAADFDTVAENMSPVRSFRLNDISGSVAVDSMGNGNGVYNGNFYLDETGLLPSDSGSSIRFDNGYIDTNYTLPTLSSGFTIGTVINIPSYVGGKYTIFSDWPSNIKNLRAHLSIETNLWRGIMGNDASWVQNTSTSYALSENTSYFILYEFEGTKVRWYVDNVLIYEWDTGISTGIAGVGELYIGKSGVGTTSYFIGYFQKFLIYEKLLTTQQKTDLFTATGL